MRLVIFDVDGTLVDSQADILAAMGRAFEAVRLAAPERARILGIVGLSLDVAMARLAPDADHARMVQAYKDAYMDLRAQSGAAQSSPLYPGARAALERLSAREDVILGVATGKSKRGLDKLIEGHGLEGVFMTQQVADFHPSKPHPSMIHQAMSEAGVSPDRTVMIGDTSFDMDMAAAAGVYGLGVDWGYHPVAALGAARAILSDFGQLETALDEAWKATA
ncbi:Phosphoglycolate phosphatase [Roseobacter fucihabitans]|uniref:Phosphoglycolate phosphatase n=1 Tax=Roseobacter fucihabitans TaxID=1537242 RepID=A0ABZ2BW57_9RHOB|nr:HAD-IA family hydrolase [Roseobacter litoralis]MBC6967437.1 Phosphoglycolate phosphatase [Roseobacter litoralis]